LLLDEPNQRKTGVGDQAMTRKPQDQTEASASRDARRAEALRANLRRRKQAASDARAADMDDPKTPASG